MNPRHTLVALSVSALIPTLLAQACGSYDPPQKAATGGSSGTAQGGTSGASGTGQAGGGMGGTGQAGGGMGGTGQAGGGMGGTGQAGAGEAGSGQAGSGGGDAGSGGSGGSGGGQALCDELAACGGDVVGTWTVADCPESMLEGVVDVTGFGLVLDCMSGPVTGTRQVSGSVTFNSDGTFMDMTTTTGDVMFDLVERCKELSGTTTSCEELTLPLQSLGFQMLTCVDNTETMGCTCNGHVMQTGGLGLQTVGAETTGTYTTSGNDLVTDSFGTETDYTYCVEGDKLAMTLETVSRTGSMTGQIVFQKQ